MHWKCVYVSENSRFTCEYFAASVSVCVRESERVIVCTNLQFNAQQANK